ncbi:TnsA-like heteromeric transposase endonuclease subunit [Nocardia gipuzkoensis]|uniref:TnsA-like heteromeric transposase endonuclease subunit n=1 Tax=Nocardia gipuzkoensis TaxID=2749991 RepID=UPI00237EC83C|nr:TnsA-like heteromeric transposase endonuclease subunit [Nocardia gipuzkoensis]MDE1672671.1 TnsA-like heteromeric transposase endonuclease subunit [Nocardia gipuzkoensis]
MVAELLAVVAVLGVVGGGAPESVAGFELACVMPGDSEVRVGLADAWALRLEDALPVRRFASFRGQRHLSGSWWSATTGRHVGFESWLERDQLMALDFDSTVVGIASQPFWLFWPSDGGGGRGVRSHAPDFFARRADGGGLVVDCRPENRRKPRDLVAFEMTRRACALAGWEYQLLGMPDPVLTANLRWLAGYRHPRYLRTEVAEGLRSAFGEPAALMDGAEAVGDPIAVLPVLFHLLWGHQLTADLSRPLRAVTPVRAQR